MTVWVCSKCGMAGASAAETRPSLDDRYAVGFCQRCAPRPAGSSVERIRRPARRPTVPLIRADLWDASELAKRAESNRLRKLLRDYGDTDPETKTIRGTAREGADGKIRYRYLSDKAAEEARRRLGELDAEAAARKSAAAP